MKTVQKSRSASAESSAESIADQEHQEHQEHQARQARQAHQAGRDSEREHPLFNTPVVTQQMVELSKTAWMSALNTTESSLQFIEECQLIQMETIIFSCQVALSATIRAPLGTVVRAQEPLRCRLPDA